MKATLLKSLTFLLAALLSGPTLLAQGHHGADKPGRQEVKAYYQANVLPVVRQQRQKLEAQLATDDKAQLATYRKELQDLHQRRQGLVESLKAAGTPQSPPILTEAQKQQLQELRSASREIMVKVGLLAKKYEAPLAQLAQEIQPQKEKWTTDLKAIAAKNATPEQLEKRKEFGGHHRGGSGSLGQFFRPARFLLLDPNAPATPATTVPNAGLNVYPNPAAANNQLDYSVQKAGPVTIEILDGRGNTLRPVLQNQHQDKGSHTLTTNLSDLPAGTYFYKITTRSGSETKRFVKQ
ncbi:T9SS type A sorting domain-containing protein [Hymenobacter cellulosivorans]|uniref:T9SS type A sorting domain-containing protein n=1 Tax=Hymenobacter cellulosivorans TaxID=2932249 RepID=A0ABY4FKD6_9BACT|nr:T9SS type A sorting domain-containing protein [Hymenobacter cellulosivorans]UOQ55376.1 T9SS type A sorting domain-containing protein [Hymenobacter cellulosivorans]